MEDEDVDVGRHVLRCVCIEECFPKLFHQHQPLGFHDTHSCLCREAGEGIVALPHLLGPRELRQSVGIVGGGEQHGEEAFVVTQNVQTVSTIEPVCIPLPRLWLAIDLRSPHLNGHTHAHTPHTVP